MVEIIRRKNAQVEAENVSKLGNATTKMINSIWTAVGAIGNKITKDYENFK